MTSQYKQIKIALIKKGINAIDIARKEGVDPSAIYHTMRGRLRSQRLRKAVADALGISYEQLWETPYRNHSLNQSRKAVNV